MYLLACLSLSLTFSGSFYSLSISYYFLPLPFFLYMYLSRMKSISYFLKASGFELMFIIISPLCIPFSHVTLDVSAP